MAGRVPAPRVTVKVDTRRLETRLGNLSRRSPDGARIFSAVIACEVMRSVILRCDKDTNRYARGWQIAHNMAARWTDGRVTPWTVFPVKESRYAKQNRYRLEQQARKYHDWLDNLRERLQWMRTRPNYENWKSYPTTMRAIAKVEKIAAAADAQVQAIDAPEGRSAIIIGGRKTKSELASSRLARVRVQVYGGDARLVRAGSTVYVQARNLEPHAAIQEKRRRHLAQALRAARSIGLRTASRAYIDHMVEASRAA